MKAGGIKVIFERFEAGAFLILNGMDVEEKEKLVEKVNEKEMIFRDLLKHTLIKNINGKGLMLKIQLSSEEVAQKLISFCLKKGVFTDWFLYDLTACRISPPLTISSKQIRKACQIILESLDEIMEK